jgi:hypothetical protein
MMKDRVVVVAFEACTSLTIRDIQRLVKSQLEHKMQIDEKVRVNVIRATKGKK